MTARDIQLNTVRTWTPQPVAPRITQTESQSPFSQPPSCLHPLHHPTLFTKPLWHWAPKCSSDTAGPLWPGLKVAHSTLPMQGRLSPQKDTQFALSPPSGLDSLTAFPKWKLPPLAPNSSCPFPALLSPWHVLCCFVYCLSLPLNVSSRRTGTFTSSIRCWTLTPQAYNSTRHTTQA